MSCPMRPAMTAPLAPKPKARPRRVSILRHLALFRQDILSAQPAHLYQAKMAEFRTPFFRSYLLGEPALLDEVLRRRPGDFPKSERIGAGLRPLLGNSVFLSNGETWARQRRIIDPAFAGGDLRQNLPAMQGAAEAAVARLTQANGAPVEIEEAMSHAAADVIFRALFSVPIDTPLAQRVFQAFRRYQRAQPLLNLRAFLPGLPGWHRREVRRAAKEIRTLIEELVAGRLQEIAAGRAPDDLATKILTTADPETGARFEAGEMVDQVAIFFLAGHETSASALAWALYLLALDPEAQERLRAEATAKPDLRALRAMRFTRDVFRETLRLYPPVPMMVRETTGQEALRGRCQKPGAQLVLSPWHLQRNARFWAEPDRFWPERFETEEGRSAANTAYLPFSAGPRTCPGAGFAMLEGPLILSQIIRAFEVSAVPGQKPVPVAHLTVRSKTGIWLKLKPLG